MRSHPRRFHTFHTTSSSNVWPKARLSHVRLPRMRSPDELTRPGACRAKTPGGALSAARPAMSAAAATPAIVFRTVVNIVPLA
jgi:hypothetical protein